MYASYKVHGFPNFPDDLSAKEFRDELVRTLQDAEVYIAEAQGADSVAEKLGTKPESVPVGIIAMFPERQRAHVHAYWFPWSSKRNRLESLIRFIVEMRKAHTLLTITRMEDRGIMEHLLRYGLVRRVGKIRKYTDGGHDVMLYQSEPM